MVTDPQARIRASSRSRFGAAIVAIVAGTAPTPAHAARE
jgi:hypothetical protein